jgi:chromosome segregation ATPase
MNVAFPTSPATSKNLSTGVFSLHRLRDTIEELRGSLQPKENKIETLQQSLLDKDQILEDLKKQLQAVEERKQIAVTELSAKHQKNLEGLEAQVVDALSERDKAAETISSLQVSLLTKFFSSITG